MTKENKRIIIKRTYSDGEKKFYKTATWVDGEILSGYNNEILSQNGAYHITCDPGWIIADEDLNILEANTEGCVSQTLEEKLF